MNPTPTPTPAVTAAAVHAAPFAVPGVQTALARLEPLTLAEIQSRIAQGQRDFTGVSFNGLDLRHVVLSGCNLRGATFRGTVLTGTVLTGADLTGADLTGADLTGADLTGADLTLANLSEATLINANMTDCTVQFATFSGADLTGAHLVNARGGRVVFNNATLIDANLTGAVFTDGQMWGSNLQGCVLTDARLPAMRMGDVNLMGAQLERADLQTVVWGNVLWATWDHLVASGHCTTQWAATHFIGALDSLARNGQPGVTADSLLPVDRVLDHLESSMSPGPDAPLNPQALIISLCHQLIALPPSDTRRRDCLDYFTRHFPVLAKYLVLTDPQLDWVSFTVEMVLQLVRGNTPPDNTPPV